MAGTIWDDVLGRIETKVNRYSYYAWFQKTSLISDDGGTITVRVVDPGAVQWLTKHYTGVIAEALAEVGRKGVAFRFIAEGQDLDLVEAEAPAEPSLEEGNGEGPVGEPVGLSPRYSFETFIVGASNQFAHAACRAVAEAPSR